MSISKHYLKSKPECKVTFNVPAKEANKVEIAGDFNSWNLTEFKKLKNGNFKTQINLAIDKEYQFKYFIDGEWVNDAEADAYKWNDFAASDNSVIVV